MSQPHEGPDRKSTASTPPGTPRWVKVFGLLALALVLLFVVMMLASKSGHGPGRHMPSSGVGDYTTPIAHGV